MSKLKSVKEFNKERFEALKQAGKVKPNGIACSDCGNEMVDGETRYILPNLPPKIKIICLTCGNWDYRIA